MRTPSILALARRYATITADAVPGRMSRLEVEQTGRKVCEERIRGGQQSQHSWLTPEQAFTMGAIGMTVLSWVSYEVTVQRVETIVDNVHEANKIQFQRLENKIAGLGNRIDAFENKMDRLFLEASKVRFEIKGGTVMGCSSGGPACHLLTAATGFAMCPVSCPAVQCTLTWNCFADDAPAAQKRGWWA
jgi:hypothetical protein